MEYLIVQYEKLRRMPLKNAEMECDEFLIGDAELLVLSDFFSKIGVMDSWTDY